MEKLSKLLSRSMLTENQERLWFDKWKLKRIIKTHPNKEDFFKRVEYENIDQELADNFWHANQFKLTQ